MALTYRPPPMGRRSVNGQDYRHYVKSSFCSGREQNWPFNKWICDHQWCLSMLRWSDHALYLAIVDGYSLKTTFCHNSRVLLKYPLVDPWLVVPGCFDNKPTLIHIRHLNTKFCQILTPKTFWNRLRHTRTSWTSSRTSWTLLDALIIKLPKLIIYIIFNLKTMLKLLDYHVSLYIRL